MKEPRTYKHLTKTDRLRIEKWLKIGMPKKEIAAKIRVDVSTIYREINRGQYERLDGATWEMETAYSPDIAEERYTIASNLPKHYQTLCIMTNFFQSSILTQCGSFTKICSLIRKDNLMTSLALSFGTGLTVLGIILISMNRTKRSCLQLALQKEIFI